MNNCITCKNCKSNLYKGFTCNNGNEIIEKDCIWTTKEECLKYDRDTEMYGGEKKIK